MSIRNIRRQATNPGGYPGTANGAPIYVDSDDNKLKIVPAGAGSTTEYVIGTQGIPNAPTAAGSALTLTVASHDGKTIALDTLAGSTVTLPAATGSGATFKFLVTVLATSNNHIVKVASASDIIQGIVNIIDTDTAGTTTGFATAADSDTITLNRSTTGSAMRGEWLEIVDIATGVFTVKGQLANTGAGATPFSAAV